MHTGNHPALGASQLTGLKRTFRAGVPRAQDVLFLLVKDVVLLDLASLLGAFRCASQELPGSYRVRFAAPRHSVPVTGGLTLRGCERLPDELVPDTILVIPGFAGDGRLCYQRDPGTRRAIDWLHSAGRARHLICVSSGVVLAAHAGLLSHRDCTTDPAHIAELRRADPSARVVGGRSFVEDGFVSTSAGVSGGVDLALRLIGRQRGVAAVATVARGLIALLPRAGTDSVLPSMIPRERMLAASLRAADAPHPRERAHDAEPTRSEERRRTGGLSLRTAPAPRLVALEGSSTQRFPQRGTQRAAREQAADCPGDALAGRGGHQPRAAALVRRAQPLRPLFRLSGTRGCAVL